MRGNGPTERRSEMSTHRGRALGLHETARTKRARSAFRDVRDEKAEAQRAAAIAALPSKDWRGVRVYLIRCDGPFGCGPHMQYVPEGLLWSLLDLNHFLCAYHR